MKKFSTVLGILVMFVLLTTQAQALDCDACEDGRWWYPDGYNCIGLLQPSDMGSHNINGVWTWKSEFIAEVDPWANERDLPNWQIDWTPTIQGLDVTYTRLYVLQSHDKDSVTRFVLQGTKGAISTPCLWRVEGPDGEPFLRFNVPPDFIEIQTYSIGGSSLLADDLASITWNGVTISEGFWSRTCNHKYLAYQTGENVWYDTGWGVENSQPEIYMSFPFDMVPSELGITTAIFSFMDGSSFDIDFDVTNIDPMPTVAATFSHEAGIDKVTKSGKVINNEHEVISPNLIARELNGALVIQWAEPDGAMTNPNMKLRMYVGNGWGNDIPSEEFLFIDCPVQTGSVVVPAGIWAAFKTKMLDLGETEVDVAGMYRYQTKHYMVDGRKTDFHNRGYIEAITFPIPFTE